MAVKNDADYQGEATVCAILTVLPRPDTDWQYGTWRPLSSETSPTQKNSN